MPTGDDLRRVALELPEATEKLTWEVHPTFRVRDKIFAILSEDGASVRVKGTPEQQRALVGSDPETFSVPSHVGRYGWIGIQLERIDPEELREIVIEAWLRTAPRRLVKAYEAAEQA
jgi:hypothetical protein